MIIVVLLSRPPIQCLVLLGRRNWGLPGRRKEPPPSVLFCRGAPRGRTLFCPFLCFFSSDFPKGGGAPFGLSARGPSRKQNSILKRGKETVPFALFRQLLLCLDGPLRLFCEILDCPWKTSENTRVG